MRLLLCWLLFGVVITVANDIRRPVDLEVKMELAKIEADLTKLRLESMFAGIAKQSDVEQCVHHLKECKKIARLETFTFKNAENYCNRQAEFDACLRNKSEPLSLNRCADIVRHQLRKKHRLRVKRDVKTSAAVILKTYNIRKFMCTIHKASAITNEACFQRKLFQCVKMKKRHHLCMQPCDGIRQRKRDEIQRRKRDWVVHTEDYAGYFGYEIEEEKVTNPPKKLPDAKAADKQPIFDPSKLRKIERMNGCDTLRAKSFRFVVIVAVVSFVVAFF